MNKITHGLAYTSIIFVLVIFAVAFREQGSTNLQGQLMSPSSVQVTRCEDGVYKNPIKTTNTNVTLDPVSGKQPKNTDFFAAAMNKIFPEANCKTEMAALKCPNSIDCEPKKIATNPWYSYKQGNAQCTFTAGPLYDKIKKKYNATISCILKEGLCDAHLLCTPKPEQICCHNATGTPLCTSDASCPAGQQQSGGRMDPSDCSSQCVSSVSSSAMFCCKYREQSAFCRTKCVPGETPISLTPSNAEECTETTCVLSSSATSSSLSS